MTNDDSDKLKKLYEIYEQPMFRIAFVILKNNEMAEDAVSEAFMRIISKLGRIKIPESEKTKRYMVSTIKNTSINCYRRNSRLLQREMPIDENIIQIPDNKQNIEEIIIKQENISIIKNMLCDLSETDRMIVNLRCNEEMSWREVAASLSLTEANVRKRFERIKKRLIRMKGEIKGEK